jgi:hypothetical protein
MSETEAEDDAATMQQAGFCDEALDELVESSQETDQVPLVPSQATPTQYVSLEVSGSNTIKQINLKQ